jgi:dTDP-4-dehydrorhamnose reductase
VTAKRLRRVAVIGGNGQLGQDLVSVWAELGHVEEIVPLTHSEVEVRDRPSVLDVLSTISPDVVINTAAFHNVDQIEDSADMAFAVNASGALNVALACQAVDAVLVHISTDYVFAGDIDRPYVEDDGVGPINAYGASKAAGEMLIRYAWPKHFVVRTSGLYGRAGSSGKGGNFVETMLRLAAGGTQIRVVDDQVLTPTGTRALARQIVALCETDSFGTYHATCQGDCSWFEFASEIFAQSGLRPVLGPQSTTESGARARRPPHSVLENRNLQRLGIDRMPDWRESLADYLRQRRASPSAAQAGAKSAEEARP